MLKTIVLILLAVLNTVNLALLWQIYRKMHNNPNARMGTIEPYIMARLKAFGINTVIIGIIGVSWIFLQILFRAP